MSANATATARITSGVKTVPDAERGHRVRLYTLTREGARHLEREVSSLEEMLKGITRVLALART